MLILGSRVEGQSRIIELFAQFQELVGYKTNKGKTEMLLCNYTLDASMPELQPLMPELQPLIN